MIMNLESKYQDVLKSLVRPGEECVLLDYPNHSNVGDSAIWLGEHVVLKHAGIPVSSIGDLFYDSWEEIAQSVGNRTILIHGGGNFGDLWERHQIFRERLCKTFVNNRIIQLPQSIHFQDDAKRAASRETFRGHPDVHLMVRDRSSLEIAEEFAPNRSYLVPDAALCLPFQNAPLHNRPYDMLVLFRTDGESACAGLGNLKWPEGLRVHSTDWLEEEVGFWHRYYQRLRQIDRNKRPTFRAFLDKLILDSAARLANTRFQRGIDLVANARVVVTDRLHTVVLSWLCRTPVYFADNCYGKLNNVVSCWLPEEQGIHRLASHEEALSAAVASLNTAS
jgi:exopolysaccharide biosynthesis predicted pyruvyltransferase EpsI